MTNEFCCVCYIPFLPQKDLLNPPYCVLCSASLAVPCHNRLSTLPPVSYYNSFTHEKSHTGFQFASKLVTLNDLERRDGRYFA